jgi:hypothetical protein
VQNTWSRSASHLESKQDAGWFYVVIMSLALTPPYHAYGRSSDVHPSWEFRCRKPAGRTELTLTELTLTELTLTELTLTESRQSTLILATWFRIYTGVAIALSRPALNYDDGR